MSGYRIADTGNVSPTGLTDLGATTRKAGLTLTPDGSQQTETHPCRDASPRAGRRIGAVHGRFAQSAAATWQRHSRVFCFQTRETSPTYRRIARYPLQVPKPLRPHPRIPQCCRGCVAQIRTDHTDLPRYLPST